MARLTHITIRKNSAETRIEFTRLAAGQMTDRIYTVKNFNRGLRAERLLKDLEVTTTFIFPHGIAIICEL